MRYLALILWDGDQRPLNPPPGAKLAQVALSDELLRSDLTENVLRSSADHLAYALAKLLARPGIPA